MTDTIGGDGPDGGTPPVRSRPYRVAPAAIAAIGHFLIVIWTYGRSPAVDERGAQMVNGLFELRLDQFGINRAERVDPAG